MINAGAAIYAAGRAESIADGVDAARAALDEGAGAAALERFVQASQHMRPRRPRRGTVTATEAVAR